MLRGNRDWTIHELFSRADSRVYDYCRAFGVTECQGWFDRLVSPPQPKSSMLTPFIPSLGLSLDPIACYEIKVAVALMSGSPNDSELWLLLEADCCEACVHAVKDPAI